MEFLTYSTMPSPTASEIASTEPLHHSPSPGTPRAAPRDYTRREDVGFGARLANARNLAPGEAPPPSPPRDSLPISDGGPSLLPASQLGFRSGTTPRALPTCRVGKGSYVSPYDSGRTPGDVRLPSSSTTVEEFEAMYGTEARLASQNAPSEASEESDQTATSAPVAPKKLVHAVPEGVSFLHCIPRFASIIYKNYSGTVPRCHPGAISDDTLRVRKEA
jgi:hypothetical protein